MVWVDDIFFLSGWFSGTPSIEQSILILDLVVPHQISFVLKSQLSHWTMIQPCTLTLISGQTRSRNDCRAIFQLQLPRLGRWQLRYCCGCMWSDEIDYSFKFIRDLTRSDVAAGF